MEFFYLQAEAVQLIEDGKAPRITQPEEGATYDAMVKKEKAEVIYIFLLVHCPR